MQCSCGQTDTREKTFEATDWQYHVQVELIPMKCPFCLRLQKKQYVKRFRKDVTFCFLLPKQQTWSRFHIFCAIYSTHSVYKCESCDDWMLIKGKQGEVEWMRKLNGLDLYTNLFTDVCDLRLVCGLWQWSRCRWFSYAWLDGGGEFNMLTAHTHTFYVKIFSDSMVGAGFGKCLPSVWSWFRASDLRNESHYSIS